MSIRVQYFNVQ